MKRARKIWIRSWSWSLNTLRPPRSLKSFRRSLMRLPLQGTRTRPMNCLKRENSQPLLNSTRRLWRWQERLRLWTILASMSTKLPVYWLRTSSIKLCKSATKRFVWLRTSRLGSNPRVQILRDWTRWTWELRFGGATHLENSRGWLKQFRSTNGLSKLTQTTHRLRKILIYFAKLNEE